MQGSHRRNRRLNAAGETFTVAGLILSLFLAIGQMGIVAAGAADRDRSGSFTSDTTVVSSGRGSDARAGGSTGAVDRVLPRAVIAAVSNNVTVCHATKSVTNPFTSNIVDVSSSGGQDKILGAKGHASHVGTPPGNFFTLGVSANGDDWTDIIPAFNYPDPVTGPDNFAGLGLTATGLLILADGCDLLPHLGTVTKVGPASVSVGSSGYTYMVSVTNNGAGNATDVTIVDDVPTGFLLASVTWAKTNPAASGTCTATDPVSCNVGDLAPGQSVTVTITFSVGAAACPGPTVDNTASVGTTNSNTVTTDILNCPVTTAPDIAIVKSGPLSINSGGSFSYTLTVTNLGNATALGVGVTDTVPTDLAITSVSPPTPACDFVGQVVTCSLGDILASGNVVVTIDVTHNRTSCADLHNAATVTTTSRDDLLAANNTDDADTTVTCAPILTLIKTGPGSVQQGTGFSYTVTVNNSGTANAQNVVVVDDLDDSLTNVSASWTLGGTCPVTAGSNVVTCPVGTVIPAQTVTITINATAPAGVCPFISNQATGTFGAVVAAPIVIPPSVPVVVTQVLGCAAPAPVPAPGTAGIIATKTGPALAHVGDTIKYTFTATLATGSAPVSGVTVTDPICDSAVSGPTGDDGDGVLETGETFTFNCTHVVTAADPDPLPNTAKICGTGPAGQVCDDDDHTVDIVHPAIDVQKEADPAFGTVGTVITYTYTVTNSGDVDLLNVSVDDDVLKHICDIATLHPHETVTCTGTFTIPKDAPVELTNIVIAGGTDPAGTFVDDKDQFTIDVVLGTTVTPTKTPPAGVAFTGTSTVLPLSGLALILLLLGSGMLWASRNRGKYATGADQG